MVIEGATFGEVGFVLAILLVGSIGSAMINVKSGYQSWRESKQNLPHSQGKLNDW